MNRPLHDAKDAKGVDESSGHVRHDRVAGARHVAKNNGRVGIWGFRTTDSWRPMAMVNPHPALKAVSEQACMGDAVMGNDFFHNGAVPAELRVEYAA